VIPPPLFVINNNNANIKLIIVIPHLHSTHASIYWSASK
jgi:hypothetical protein